MMSKRSKIATLPIAIRRWLDTELSENNFGEYELLAEELKKRGYDISKSAVHRYGQGLEKKLAAIKASTQAAAAIADAAPDDADMRSAAVISLIQTDVFDVLIKLQEADAETNPSERLKLLGGAAKSIAELSRASVNQKRWQVEVRQKTLADAANAVGEAAAAQGMDAAQIDFWRGQVLGLNNG
jgi:hypothetical protein